MSDFLLRRRRRYSETHLGASSSRTRRTNAEREHTRSGVAWFRMGEL
eukprot:CAMPEP_0180260860 /NCGR_PEP_ID=MMETSP0987-20121128/43830_1 /TAXON_ID=697907 /ORGANISM="non described non described, Strain CCMP2293" /LENGTH=46 /DNA_ID= /DNA_START= /DNA_END= /DNA_ORIENTATION=